MTLPPLIGSVGWVEWLLLGALLTACGPAEPASLEEAAAQPQPPQAHAPSDELDRLADAMFERELALPIRLWVIEQVAADPDPRAVPMLARLLEDPDIEVVRAAVSALASRPEPAAQQALLPLRAHHDAEITRRIGQLLGAPR